MSFVARLLRPQNQQITTSHELAELLAGGAETEAGIHLTPKSALRAATVYACVRVIAEGLAMMPLNVYRRLEGGGRERDTEHWLQSLLRYAPNSWQTSFEWIECMTAHTVLSGMSYSVKTVVGDEDRVRELLPVLPSRVTVEQDERLRLLFKIRMPDGSTLDVPQERMFYIPGLCYNGVTGLSPIGAQREAIANQIQMTRHSARLFRQGTFLAGVFEHPGTLSENAYDRLRDSFDEKFSGVQNAHKTMLLEEGTTWKAAGMTAEDAQFVESQKLSMRLIAQTFRVPLHMIGDLERSTFSNIEQQSIDLITHTFGPWMGRWEARVMRTLLPESQRKTHFVEFHTASLMRGDFLSRVKSYQIAILSGWLSPNQVRAKENENPGPAELDEYWRPTNIGLADDPPPKSSSGMDAFAAAKGNGNGRISEGAWS